MSGELLQRRIDRPGPTGYDHLLEVEDIHLSFKGVKAIDGVTFHVDDRELFAIIGPTEPAKPPFSTRSIRSIGHRRAKSAGRESP